MVREKLSETQLPQPAVLVVGDDSSDFSSEVWRGVVEAAQNEHEHSIEVTSEQLELVLEASRGNGNLKALRQLDLGWRQRPPTRSAIPLQLSHSHDPDPQALRRQIGQILDLFDVWAIIASASAGDVKPLRETIEGIDIPLLVTTDSTTASASDQRSNELRLMPSNKAQATAMLFTAIRVNEASAGGGTTGGPLRPMPRIAYSAEASPQARQYVRDLKRELHNEARRHNIALEEYKPRRDSKGPVIVIGYSSHAKSIIDTRVAGRLTILSDGCTTEAVYDAVRQKRSDDFDCWYVARPEMELREVGQTSFSAVQEAGRKLLTWDAGNSSGPDFLRTSLRDVIKDILSDSSNQFYFDGIENVAPAYRVIQVVEGFEPGIETPPKSTPTRATKRHLQAV